MFITLESSDKKVFGRAGCNRFFGVYEQNESQLTFSGMGATKMACPDMEVEGKVMKAINEVKSFDVLSGGGIGFYSADGTLVMVLVKK